jgi:uncharacterized membrane protein YdfJ with MMPL/SSD domain
MTAIPAVQRLLGDRAWWPPRALDRLVPNLDLDGESSTKLHARRRHRQRRRWKTAAWPQQQWRVR